MNFFDSFLVDTIFIIFPLLVYMIYVTYKKNIDQDIDDVVFQLALFTSLYLIMRYGSFDKNSYMIFLVNVPLIFAFTKNRKITPIIITILLITFYTIFMKYNFYFILLEYSIYFFIYLYYRNKNKDLCFYTNVIVVLKAFFFTFLNFYFLNPTKAYITNIIKIIISSILFYLTMQLYKFLLDRGRRILSLDITLKDLEREKELQQSLFKITHEIKNPIAVCKGYLDMLNLDDTKKVKKYIPIVKEEIARTLTLMDDFLDYSKISINKEILDINVLLEDTLYSMEPLFKEKHAITNFKTEDRDIYIEGDYNRLKQVLVNIFKNSFEAKKKNEELKIDIAITSNNKTLQLVIFDNGKGISKNDLKKLGEAFFTTKQNGTGLGVCLSKEIIKKHGGTIIYDSQEDKGTSITITLPIYQMI